MKRPRHGRHAEAARVRTSGRGGHGGKPDQQKFLHSRYELAAIFLGRALRFRLRVAHSLGQHLAQLSLGLGRLAGRFPLGGILAHS
jgi:hypothetical protein